MIFLKFHIIPANKVYGFTGKITACLQHPKNWMFTKFKTLAPIFKPPDCHFWFEVMRRCPSQFRECASAPNKNGIDPRQILAHTFPMMYAICKLPHLSFLFYSFLEEPLFDWLRQTMLYSHLSVLEKLVRSIVKSTVLIKLSGRSCLVNVLNGQSR